MNQEDKNKFLKEVTVGVDLDNLCGKNLENSSWKW